MGTRINAKLNDSDVLHIRQSVASHSVMMARHFVAGGVTMQLDWKPSCEQQYFVMWSRVDEKQVPPDTYTIGSGHYFRMFDTLEEAVLEYNSKVK